MKTTMSTALALVLVCSLAATLPAQTLLMTDQQLGIIFSCPVNSLNSGQSPPPFVPLVSGLNGPTCLAVSGGDIFVVNAGLGTIGEYTTAGAPVNPSLISGLNNVGSIAISGSDIFVFGSTEPNKAGTTKIISE